MKKFMQKKLNQKGLTLVELLAVIVILGIIAAIAVPAIGNIITNSKVNALKGDAHNVLSAAQMYFTEKGGESVTQAELITNGFLEDAGGFAAATGATAATVTKSTDVAKGNTITGAAVAKGVKVSFAASTKKDITDAENKGTTGTVTVTR
ncbi:Tfp assembly type protein [Sporosarcina sp. P16b]|uniref:type II secretion system protein n=1 Tax=Sporosarcina sp. P16b TaxID=2048261 RepID=UPI000C169861|nr:prepilin-type N-terminal cleavage/methylation domain-containing protein [Sporosarcina sp. P16b]PIC70699.1 Tfp assembly type protein [Sporosarcina sp. P16b]